MTTSKFTCALATLSTPCLVCKATATLEGSQTHLFFNFKAFLHVIHYKTIWSEIKALRTRRLYDQIYVLERIHDHLRGIPKVICDDQGYNKKECLTFCRSFNIEFIFVAANYDKSNSIVEKAVRSICDHVNRIALEEARTSPA